MTAFDNIKKSYSKKDNYEWFTPPKWIELARKTMGSIDLDPASNEEANKIVKAESFYTKDQDGLSQNWFGNVWLNPPFSAGLISKFADKVIDQYPNYEQAIIITDNCTETNWWQSLAKNACCILFVKTRIRFLNPNGSPGPYPYRGQTIFYLGPNQGAAAFVHVFENEGTICL